MTWVTRRRLMLVLRVAFFIVIAWFVWWGLHGRVDDVVDAVKETPVLGLVSAFGLVLLGLLATGFMWLCILRGFGYALPSRDGLPIFFLGQLGKYIPGSVWSFGAQADQARKHDVPIRVTIGASMVFLGVNVATAVVLGFGVALATSLDVGLPGWVVALGAALGLLSLAPPVVNRLATRVAGSATPLRLGIVDLAEVLALMIAAWAAYAGALYAIRPDATGKQVAALVAAFLIAYAAGVLVFLAPAGLGAREATFVLVAAPVTGVAVATSVALLSRVLFTLGDVVLAGAAVAAARWSRARRGRLAA